MAQQQKTEPIGVDLPDINEEQISFARLVGAGVNQSKAYRQVYGTDYTDEVIWAASSRLANDVKVKLWIAYVRRGLLSKETYTFDAHMQELDELQDIAVRSGNVGAAVNAAVHKGKALGHYTEKSEITINNQGADLFLERMQAKANEDKTKH